MSNAGRVPNFSKTKIRAASTSGKRIPVNSSAGCRCVLPGPTRNSSIGRQRMLITPSRLQLSSTSASSSINGTNRSPAGEALQILPPRVAALRIWLLAKQSAARASTGAYRAISGSHNSSLTVVNGPSHSWPACSRTPRSALIRRILTSTGCQVPEPVRCCGTRSVPPAITAASPWASSAVAVLTDCGTW